jgi:DNA-binding CsgD family transcriptional regulator
MSATGRAQRAPARGISVAAPQLASHRLMTISTRVPGGSREVIPILERERELEALDAAVARAEAGLGSAILIVGEAGIGKSTLALYAVDAAHARSIRVLRAQGGELERGLPYGVVVDLFGTLARAESQPASLFSGPAHVVTELLGLAPGSTQDPVAYVHGLYWLVLNLVERGPLVMVVDDAQWADESSLRFLHRLVQRVEELPLVVILAMRPLGDSPASPAGTLLRAERAVRRLAPEPLSEAAVGDLVARLGPGDLSGDLRRACWRATSGNPFFVAELATELSHQDPGSIDAAAIGSFVPSRVGRFVAARLATADPRARCLAEAVAILGESASLDRAAALAGTDRPTAAEMARSLVEAGILADAPAPAFRHPIVRACVAAAVPAPARAQLHRRAGLLLADEGVDASVIGAQLREAEARGDARVVELLVAASDAATARGEPDAAVTLLRRALAEPPGDGLRAAVLSKLARAEAAAGSPAAAATYTAALRLLDRASERAALLLELGHTLVGAAQWAAARDTFERGLAVVGEGDQELRARLEAGFLSSAWITMEDRPAISTRVQEILASEELGAANRELGVWIAFQQAAVVGSTARAMSDLVKRALSEEPIEALVRQGQIVEIGVGVLVEADELPLEVAILTRALEAVRRTGPIGKAGVYAYCRSWPNYYMGRLADALADTDEARRAAELGWESYLPAATAVAVMAHIERADLESAAAVLTAGPEEWPGRIDAALLLPLAAGRLALARGDPAAAADHLRRAKDDPGAAFMRNGPLADWRTWYATALLRLGRREAAREVSRESVDIARAWGAPGPLGAALRVAGLVEGGHGGLELLREAEALFRDSPARLEQARLLVDLGSALRRNGSLTEARGVLARAAALAREIGARALLTRATAELRAAGARPRRVALTGVDSLTPAELRVARQALDGRTNREIAQQLFVTPKAVEFHLANAYRKLGIASRSELPGAMGTAGRG